MIRRLFRRRKATKVFVTITQPYTDEELADRVQRELLRRQRRNGGTTGIR